MIDPQALDRVGRYLSLRGSGVQVKAYLGGGTDGDVWETSIGTAAKAFRSERGYFNERDCYQRLADFGVTEELDGFRIPEMHGWDDQLMVVEMDLMQHPPYIIDFAKVRIDRPPDFSREVLQQFEAEGSELFDENWPTVKSLLAALESFQIYYLDPKPHNIVFPPRDPD